MKKHIFLFVTACLATVNSAQAAVAIKKSAPVAKAETSATSAATNLLPTVIGLYSGIQDITKKQKEMTAECKPTAQEIQWVDNIIKEWAKTGAMSADEVSKRLGRKPCPGGNGYEAAVRSAAPDVCFNNYADSDKDQIWYGYPKVGTATYCADGSFSCSDSNKKYTTDMYDLFNKLIDFAEADYTKQEATMAAKLIAKIEQCSDSKLSAKKQALWGEFLTGTLSNIGQGTNTGAIMQSVGGIAGSGGLGGLGGLSSIGGIAAQFLDK